MPHKNKKIPDNENETETDTDTSSPEIEEDEKTKSSIFSKKDFFAKKSSIKKYIDIDTDSEESDDDRSIITEKKVGKNSNEIFKELIKRQLPDVPPQWKLNINDMKRICKYIDTSIFDKKNCCLWNGYITNLNNSVKGSYINFYFRNKKVALHRLLYSNFVAPLSSSEYLKFTCPNKGRCCCVNHYDKYKYSNHNNEKVHKEKKIKESKKEKDVIIIGPTDEDDLIIDFNE